MKKKKKKPNNKICKALNYLLLISTVIFIIMIFILDIFSFKKILILLFIIFIIELILSFFLCHPKVKNSIKKRTFIFTLVLIVILNLSNIYLYKTLNFLKNVTTSSSKIINYSILVNIDSNYTMISELKDKKMGYYNLNSLPNSSINISVDYDSYNDPSKMYIDLFNGIIDSILVEDSIKKIVEEENIGFREKTKVLNTFVVYEKEETEMKGVNVLTEPFSIYISGIDTYGNISSVSRSDVNIVATINPKTNTILLTSIPRDYYVTLYQKKGYKDKLTHAGIYGVDTSIKTIENLLDVEINYYVKVNFTSVIDIVNILGGVEVQSEYDFISFDGYNFHKGLNNLNGEEALSFARERHAFAGGDRDRNKNQQVVIQALINKLNSKVILSKYNDLLSIVGTKVKTNMPEKQLMALAKNQIKNNTEWNVISYNLDGTNGNEYTYSYKNQKLYVMIPDEESLKYAKEKIEEVKNGK